MLAEERFALILDLLARQRTATVQELCEALSASESTIRRDLNELDKLGKLNQSPRRSHTAGQTPSAPTNPPWPPRKRWPWTRNRASHRRQLPSSSRRTSSFLDAGSTTLAVARLLSGPALKASYVTNGVAHARLLAQKGCRVFLPGGLLAPRPKPSSGRRR